jgi:hypothetical protein
MNRMKEWLYDCHTEFQLKSLRVICPVAFLAWFVWSAYRA